MRLLDISSFFSDSCGGIKSYYRQKARFLPALGLECHFLVPGRRASEQPFEQGCLHRLPGPPLPGNAQYRLFGSRGRLVRLVRRLAPDVIEVGSHFLLPGWVAMACAGVPSPPAVVGFLHSDIPRTMVAPHVSWLPAPGRRLLLDAAWSFFRRRHAGYRATLVASRRLQERLTAVGIPRVRWVGLGVDLDTFCAAAATAGAATRPGPGPALTVAYAGRLSGDKELGVLLAAWPTIHAATGARLRVVGDGQQRARLERQAAEDRSISYEGCLQRPADVAAVLAIADLVVTPGAFETFSLSTAEALACGTPVVAPDEGGAGELVADSGAGKLFRPHDPAALAAAAIELLHETAASRAARGARGRAHVAHLFAWPDVARRLHDIYREVAATRSSE